MRAPFLVVTALSVCVSACLSTCTPAAQTTSGPAQPHKAAPTDDIHSAKGAVLIHTPAGPQRYTVELALTASERSQGLMFREHLEDDAGMLFVFEDMRVQSFWMKNTRIPLDMIFIDDNLVIAGIVESAEPLTLNSRRVDKESRYVLELAGGVSRKRGIAPGQQVAFEDVPTQLTNKVTP